MELQKIELLLEKYWHGESSLEEEQILQRFFTEEEVPEHLQGVATLFQQYKADQQFKTLDDRFDEAILHTIEKSDSDWDYKQIFRIAAAVAFLIVSILIAKDHWFEQTENKAITEKTITNTIEDPKLAYEQTKQALLLISSMMNEGTQHLEKLETFSEAQDKIKENTL